MKKNRNKKFSLFLKECNESLNDLQKKLEEIRNRISEKPSAYLLYLYIEKIRLLMNKLEELYTNYEQLTNERKEEIYKRLYIGGLISGSFIALPFILPTIPSIIVSIISIIYNMNFLKYHNKVKSSLTEIKKTTNEFNQLTDFSLETINSLRLAFKELNEKSFDLSFQLTKAKSNNYDMDCANAIILNYLCNCKINDDIPDNIHDLTIKILQDELKTEESNLENLLKISKENINSQKAENVLINIKKLN